MANLLANGPWAQNWQAASGPDDDKGGQGHTYLARRRSDGTEGVLKILSRKGAHDPKARFRMHLDVYAVTQLSHPNVMEVLEHNTSEHADPEVTLYYVTRREPHGMLSKHSTAFAGDIDRALPCFLDLCGAVQAAHDVSIVHRDIKAGNVVFREPGPAHPVLIDFGICHVDGVDAGVTSVHEQLGPKMRPPELAVGGVVRNDPRTDVYLLGKLLYFMLSGGTEYDRELDADSGAPIHRTQGWDLSRRWDDPRFKFVNAVLDRTITPRLGDRYPSIQTLAKEIRTILEMGADTTCPAADLREMISRATLSLSARNDELSSMRDQQRREKVVESYFQSVASRVMAVHKGQLGELQNLLYCNPLALGHGYVASLESVRAVCNLIPQKPWRHDFSLRLSAALSDMVGVCIGYYLACGVNDEVTCLRVIFPYRYIDDGIAALSVSDSHVACKEGVLGSEALIARLEADAEPSLAEAVRLFAEVNK